MARRIAGILGTGNIAAKFATCPACVRTPSRTRSDRAAGSAETFGNRFRAGTPRLVRGARERSGCGCGQHRHAARPARKTRSVPARGKAALCEKPFTLNMAEARRPLHCAAGAFSWKGCGPASSRPFGRPTGSPRAIGERDGQASFGFRMDYADRSRLWIRRWRRQPAGRASTPSPSPHCLPTRPRASAAGAPERSRVDSRPRSFSILAKLAVLSMIHYHQLGRVHIRRNWHDPDHSPLPENEGDADPFY